MIGRRVALGGGGNVPNISPINFGTGKTLAIAVRGNTGTCAYGLALIVDGKYKPLENCVLEGLINPVVLCYSVMNNTSFVIKDVLNLYTGSITSAYSFSDFAVILSFKPGYIYKGIQLYSYSNLNSSDRGLEMYLFDGGISTMLSNDVAVINTANKTSGAYTLSNIINNCDCSFSTIPRDSTTSYKYYAGNSLVRGDHDYAVSLNTASNSGRCDIFCLYWDENYGGADFLGASDAYRISTTLSIPVPRINVSAGTADYSFKSPLLFE